MPAPLTLPPPCILYRTMYRTPAPATAQIGTLIVALCYPYRATFPYDSRGYVGIPASLTPPCILYRTPAAATAPIGTLIVANLGMAGR